MSAFFLSNVHSIHFDTLIITSRRASFIDTRISTLHFSLRAATAAVSAPADAVAFATLVKGAALVALVVVAAAVMVVDGAGDAAAAAAAVGRRLAHLLLAPGEELPPAALLRLWHSVGHASASSSSSATTSGTYNRGNLPHRRQRGRVAPLAIDDAAGHRLSLRARVRPAALGVTLQVLLLLLVVVVVVLVVLAVRLWVVLVMGGGCGRVRVGRMATAVDDLPRAPARRAALRRGGCGREVIISLLLVERRLKAETPTVVQVRATLLVAVVGSVSRGP
jgi:hypothetical protein